MDPGQQIGAWVVERAIGRGATGAVLACHRRGFSADRAAIKVLDRAGDPPGAGRASLLREAELLRRLDHPGVVHVRGVRVDLEPPHLELELVEGAELDVAVRRPLAAVVPVLVQLADALTHIHAHGVCHRDLKPSNVRVRQDGSVVLVDFGSAERVGSSVHRPPTGSLSYAPPEWLDMDETDGVLHDLYSLGVVAWELLAGRRAFPVPDGASHREIVRVLAAKVRMPALDPGPDMPEALRQLVIELTRADPSVRLGSAAEAHARFEAVREAAAIPGVAARQPDAPAAEPACTRVDGVIEVRWRSASVFAEWCRTQLENYWLMLDGGGVPLPRGGDVPIRLVHGELSIDCLGSVLAAADARVAYRLRLEPLAHERLRRWRQGWDARVCAS